MCFLPSVLTNGRTKNLYDTRSPRTLFLIRTPTNLLETLAYTEILIRDPIAIASFTLECTYEPRLQVVAQFELTYPNGLAYRHEGTTCHI